nr:hypothetical protein [uncultured Roseateles sp.]
MTNTYYVKAELDNLTGRFARCWYFEDAEGTVPAKLPLSIGKSAGGCTFALIQTTDLVLISATYKTLGADPVQSANNFSPAVNNQLTVPMPTKDTVIKGVVLLFSNAGKVESLYPSADPQVENDGP